MRKIDTPELREAIGYLCDVLAQACAMKFEEANGHALIYHDGLSAYEDAIIYLQTYGLCEPGPRGKGYWMRWPGEVA